LLARNYFRGGKDFGWQTAYVNFIKIAVNVVLELKFVLPLIFAAIQSACLVCYLNILR
jgi:hypothetical protein